MKRLTLSIILAALVIAAVFAAIPVQTAQAINGDGNANSKPFALAGTTRLLIPENLLGTLEINNRLVPIWEPVGEVQYQGERIEISGLGSGTTTVKFDFRQAYYGWEGKIYRWSGTKWVAQKTTMEWGGEEAPTYATAVVPDGTYALLVWYTGK